LFDGGSKEHAATDDSNDDDTDDSGQMTDRHRLHGRVAHVGLAGTPRSCNTVFFNSVAFVIRVSADGQRAATMHYPQQPRSAYNVLPSDLLVKIDFIAYFG